MMVRFRIAAVLACAVVIGGCAKDPEVAKREYVESGDAYVKQEKYAEAVVEYRNAIQQDPKFGQARYKLAETYIKLGQPGDAYGEYIRAADLLPNDLDSQTKAAGMLLAAGRFLDAQTRAEKALAIAPKHVDAQLIKAAALAGMKKFDEAVVQVESAIQAEPMRVGSHLDLGRIETLRGNQQAAEEAFKRAVESDPKSVPAKLALANFYWMSNRRDEAETLLKEQKALDPANVQVNRALAAFYLATGRPPLAEEPLKAIVDATKEDSARFGLAEYYLATGRRDEAKSLMHTVSMGTGQTASMASVRLATLAVLNGQRSEAYKLIDQAVAKSPKNEFALLARAEMLTDDRKLDEALVAAKEAIAARPSPSAVSELVLGRIHTARSEYAEAQTALNEAVRLNPRWPPPHLQLARLHLATGRVDEGMAAAQEALKIQPNSREGHLLVSRAALAKGDVASAESTIRLLVANDPKSATIQAQAGMLQLAKKNTRDARIAFERAIQLDPNQMDALNALSMLDIQSGNGVAARERLEKRLGEQPANAALRILAARTYIATRDLAGAERVLREAINLDSSMLMAYGMLGQLYAAQNRLDHARQEFEQVAKRVPKSAGPPTLVAVLYQMQNNKVEARRWYERALAIDSSAAVAANNLAWLTAEEGGNLDVALQLAQTAKSRLQDRPEVDDTLGWIYYRKGLTGLAIQSFITSVEKDPRNATYHYHLGLAYISNGETEKARKALGQALSLKPTADELKAVQDALQKLNG